MNCKNCGAPLDEGAQFCRKCGTSVDPIPEREAHPVKKDPASFFANMRSKLTGNRMLLYPIAGGILLLTIALILVVSVVSCSHKAMKTPEDVADAVVSALQKGDGDALASLAKTSAPFLGRHTEQFGEGDSPEAVMKAYYRRLTDDLRTRLSETYGKDFLLEAQLEAELSSGTAVFEPNRALKIDAEQYAVLSGPLSVSGNTVGMLQIVAAQMDGEWKLLVVYVD